MDEKRLEILKMARELVINEHTDRRAELHNQWLVQSERMWAMHRQRVPYPSIPPYPTEEIILERAILLLRFVDGCDIAVTSINENSDNVAELAQHDLNLADQQQLDLTAESITEETNMRDVPRPPRTPPEDADQEMRVPEMKEVKLSYNAQSVKDAKELDDSSRSTGRLMPNVFKKLDEMRRRFGS
jgi:hypothetical protein